MIAWHIAALGLYHGGLLFVLLYGLFYDPHKGGKDNV